MRRVSVEGAIEVHKTKKVYKTKITLDLGQE